MPFFSLFVAVAVVATLTAGATAVRVVSRLWLRHWIEHHQPGQQTLRKYMERPARLVHAASTGITLTVLVWGAGLSMAEGTRSVAFVRDAIVGLLILLVLGQLLPRAIGRRWAPQLVPVLVPVMRLVDILVTPFLRVAQSVTQMVVRPGKAPTGDIREGLEDLIREGALEGFGTTEEMAIISGVMQFGDKTVADVMTARSDIFALDSSLSPREVAERLSQSGYSRVPLYNGTLDNLVGMIHVFDVFKEAGEKMPPLRPIKRTSRTRAANELLFELLRTRQQMAMVMDERNLVVGLVTMEDLLEELVGEINDEHDELIPDSPKAS
jgi:putative hemolysin